MGSVISVQLSSEPLIACFWAGCTREARYIRDLEDNLKELEASRARLQSLKNDVLRRVVNEETAGVRRLDEVQWWLYKVDDAKAETDELIRDAVQEVDKLCLGGCCSKDCSSSYKCGKRVVELQKHVAGLTAEGHFGAVAVRVISEPSVSRPSEPSVGLEDMLDKVRSTLEDELVGIVGLYGIGGVGKTTLLTQINNAFFDRSLSFDVVIWVDAPADLELEEIQAQIGEKLGFTDQRWRRKSSSDKAADIFSASAKMKFLLLLDDLWGRVDLAEVGVPLLKAQDKGSKIVFTTRSVIVCKQMGAQRMILLEPLPEKPAWALFESAVGKKTLNCHPELPFLARDIVKECCGLPLALVTVGCAMSFKTTPEEWRYACGVLRKYASDLTGDEVIPLLKFGYDYLRNDKIRSCLLYCALFPEGFKISKDDLIDYWICEGFWNDGGIEVSSRAEAYDIIESLVHACLLQDGGNYVKMHGLIRDMAIYLAGKDFLVKARAKLIEAPEVGKWEEARRISLMKNSIESLAEAPSCPKLQTLFLCCNPHLFKIADTFFQSMDGLTVLDLSRTNLLKLPFGISQLVSLQYLNLSQTFIEELPLEFEKLEKLKYLNLEHTDCLAIIPRDLIARLSLLQVLKMFCCGVLYGKKDNNVLSDGNVLLRELYELQHLEVLTITIRGSVSPLQNFPCAGNKLLKSVQTLSLEHLIGSKSLNVSLLVDMKHLETLQISHNNDLEELIVESVGEGPDTEAPGALYELELLRGRYFENLREVNVRACSRLRELTWLIILAPNLVVLSVRICRVLEAIFSESLGEALELEVSENQKPFSKLEVLILENLPQLTSIYWKSLSFPHLKRIQVINCPNLARLPLTSDTAEGSNFVIEAEESWWGLVQWENEATKKAFQPCFVRYASDIIDPWD